MTPYLVAGSTAAASLFVAFLASDWATRAWNVSDMEGGRAMLVVFLFTPLGGVFGGMLGLWLASRGLGAGDPAGRVLVQALVTATGVIGLLAATAVGVRRLPDQAPLSHGRRHIDMELRMAADREPLEALRSHATGRFHASQRIGRDLEVRWAEARTDGDYIVVPAAVAARYRFYAPSVVIGMNGADVFSGGVPLPNDPGPEATDWSEWAVSQKWSGYGEWETDSSFAVRWKIGPGR